MVSKSDIQIWLDAVKEINETGKTDLTQVWKQIQMYK